MIPFPTFFAKPAKRAGAPVTISDVPVRNLGPAAAVKVKIVSH
jgi:hypothetical protein